MIILKKIGRESELAELVSAKRLHEEPASVFKNLGGEHNHVA